MEIADHIDALRREGGLMAEAIAATPPDAPVPTCPEWRLRDLVHHTGGVHRWAATHVAEARSELVDVDLPDLVGGWPADTELEPWFRAGHAGLVDALAAAPADLECFTFLPSPSPLAFWARRQAHETTMHRVDAEAARGGAFSEVPAPVAADGIDELLAGFTPRPRSRLLSDEPRSLLVRADDTGDQWVVRISADPPVLERDGGPADTTVWGPANRLYLFLWNRAELDSITAEGDLGVLDLWRATAHIRWR